MTPFSANRKRVTGALGSSQSINLTLLCWDRWPCWHNGFLAPAWRKRRGDRGKPCFVSSRSAVKPFTPASRG